MNRQALPKEQQPEERFGIGGVDEDGDGFVNELTRADITAAVVYQATLPVPGRVVAHDSEIEKAVQRGEKRFGQIGCTACHIVTTADHFSAPAIEAAHVARELELVREFEMFDMGRRFLDIFKLVTREHSPPPWREFIPTEFLEFVNNPEIGEAIRIRNQHLEQGRRRHYRIASSAYMKWLDRARFGLPGDALGDWLDAEREESAR